MQLAAGKGVQFEREILDAKHSGITYKIAQLEDKVSLHFDKFYHFEEIWLCLMLLKTNLTFKTCMCTYTL